ncbi:MAG: hypothetical protein CMJ67_04125 [Planctomycetaceae bacterium]|nr:hypothetical protein [Planctomycetaceae bacterium]
MNQNSRIHSYASMAIAATAGGVIGVDATADVVTFDVGVTISVSPGGSNTFITSSTQIMMDPFGHSMEFAVNALNSFNTERSSSFIRQAGWVAFAGEENGPFEVAKSGGKSYNVENFAPGGVVNGDANWGYPGGLGGKSFDVSLPEKSVSSSGAEGFLDGRTYIGFRIMNDGLGDPTFNYGWFELDVSVDAFGATLTIERWGYETDVDTAASIPGGPVVPGASGLLALAMGAAGIRGRRQRVA